jgi:thiol:disulfide interchange protein DsbD
MSWRTWLATVSLIGSGVLQVAHGQQEIQVAAGWATDSTASARVLSVRFSMPDGFYVYQESLSVQGVAPVSLKPLRTPAPKQKHDPFTDAEVTVYEHEAEFAFAVEPADAAALDIKVGYQACSPTLCYRPTVKTLSVTGDAGLAEAGETVPAAPAAPLTAETPPAASTATASWREPLANFRIGASASGYLKSEAFLKFLDGAETSGATAEPSALDTFRQRGVWLSCLLILFWGLALNLTPCVLPMIPVNIAIIGAGVHASSRGRGLLLGGAYGLGIALVYGALGLVVVLTGARFGALNASPWFNLVISGVFVVLALGMFDVLPIDFSRFQGRLGAGGGSAQGGRVLGALALGGVAALLAGACVAPVVIWVLLLSADLYSRGNAAGLLLPFLLGVGMALPWPLAGAGLSILPKPGRWMERIKVAFGVIILLVALWYGRLGVSLLMARTPGERAKVEAAQNAHAAEGWHTNLADALAEARRDQRPLLIDFWATWCKSCLHMEKTTFRDPAVTARMEAFVKVKFQAEDPADPALAEQLDYFGVIGLPTYVVLMPLASPP